MSFIAGLRWWTGLGDRKMSPSSEAILRELYGRLPSASGVTVNLDTALQVSTFFAANRVLGNGVAQVPFRLMRKVGEGNSVEADDLPLAEVCRLKPNDWMTSFELRQLLMWHVLPCGSAFFFKNVVGGQVVELLPLLPQRMAVKQLDDWRLVYTYTAANGQQQSFPAESIWHVRGPSLNGVVGVDIIKLAREALGLSIAIERAQGKLHKNGIQTNGAWSVEQKLTDEQHQQLTAWIKHNYANEEKNGLPLVLDSAAKWQSITMSGVDAQTLESRRFQIEEVCRMVGVMPIMVGHSDKAATYASAEQMFLAHVVHSLSPWYTNIEQSAAVNLLTPAQRKAGYYLKFFDQALMRGAAKDRGEFYAKGMTSGWLMPNEVRAREDLNAIPGLDEEHRKRLSSASGAKPAQAEDPESDEPPADPADNPAPQE